MLNRKHSVTGMAFCDHASYGGMLVVLYAGGYKPNAEGMKEVEMRQGN
jgi:hypothetical protein